MSRAYTEASEFDAPYCDQGDSENLPVRIDKVVVFPAPLGPRRTVICPSYTLKDKFFTAVMVSFSIVNSCENKKRNTNFMSILAAYKGQACLSIIQKRINDRTVISKGEKAKHRKGKTVKNNI